MGKDPVTLRHRFLEHIEKHWEQNDHCLKSIPAVYAMIAYDFFDKSSDIVYFGSTTNLFLRYKSHKIPKKIQDSGKINILFFLPMDKGFYDYEMKLIRRLKPAYNRQHKDE